ncbi:hypothetical protein [Amycolatopsis anabasis]|uniref:hypothetical protein n=1 Tax=Amycolatopsis anabasis TaxID=1840409 RepID=UPI001FE54A0D|nr:hypothetical protein [Amycolatopsis anabasis]
MVVQEAVTAGPPGLLRPRRASRPAPPFIVVGRINEREEVTSVASPAEALELMMRWLDQDEEARAVWYLRDDWPEAITVIGRPAAGAVGETQRSTHLFPIEPGVVHCGSLVAGCGTELPLPRIEWLRLGAGMPCERCLATTNTPDAPRPRLMRG